jgi:lysine/ornithine N-monooxygenase
MKLILRYYLWLGRNKTYMEKRKRLNDFANWTSEYARRLYDDYCKNLSKILREMKRGGWGA